jgi:hypothetical protein
MSKTGRVLYGKAKSVLRIQQFFPTTGKYVKVVDLQNK